MNAAPSESTAIVSFLPYVSLNEVRDEVMSRRENLAARGAELRYAIPKHRHIEVGISGSLDGAKQELDDLAPRLRFKAIPLPHRDPAD